MPSPRGPSLWGLESPAPGASADVAPGTTPEAPLTVGDFGATMRRRVESTFGARGVWVEGEVRERNVAASGHTYFTLRDETSPEVVRCALWKQTTVPPADRAVIENGARLVVHGRVTLFSGKSEVSLTVDTVRKQGRGALLEAREALKAKLEAEGLFAQARKRPIPTDPRVVGIVTSRSGAVVHDVRTVAFQRGGARLLLAPAVVQGQGAPDSLVAALELLARVDDVDVIIFGRGGGSAEDLACFDDERVVRAVAACPKPVVSAVGHETDVTLVDFAADVRAATPSQAAELCIPAVGPRRAALLEAKRRLWTKFSERMADARAHAADTRDGLERFVETLRDRERVVDTFEARLRERASERLRLAVRASDDAHRRLLAQHPTTRLATQRTRAHDLNRRLRLAATKLLPTRREVLFGAEAALPQHVRARVALGREALAGAAARLEGASPLAILSRGYALVRNEAGRAVRRIEDAPAGSRVTVRTATATFTAHVEVAVPHRGDGSEGGP